MVVPQDPLIVESAMIFGRERQGRASPLWDQRLFDNEQALTYALTSGDFTLWQQCKRQFVEAELIAQPWLKTSPSGISSVLHFYADGVVREELMFSQQILSGHWRLVSGKLEISITQGCHQYRFVAIADSQSDFHSAVQFEDCALHAFCKLVPLATTATDT